MTIERFHHIGTPGQPWTDDDKKTWFEERQVKRSYKDEVLSKIEALGDTFEVAQYGALDVDSDRYPLFAVTCPASDPSKPWALITGGVHGYETSGVQGALQFLATKAKDYKDKLNLLVLPCVSPWGYEMIHRWNPKAVDPNRSFVANSPSQEAAAAMVRVAQQSADYLVHMDLHETTDSDETEFRPSLAARDGKSNEPGTIPDGFYTVGDTENPQPEFQKAIISAVEKVTHIAPPDENGEIIGCKVEQNGVVNYGMKELGLCGGMTNAQFTSTTEVYPDSPKVTDENCNAAQVAAACAALDFAIASAT